MWSQPQICFLCRTRVRPLSPRLRQNVNAKSGLKVFLKYLNITGVLGGSSSIGRREGRGSFADSAGRGDSEEEEKVVLCRYCSGWVDRFWRLYEDFEAVRLELCQSVQVFSDRLKGTSGRNSGVTEEDEQFKEEVISACHRRVLMTPRITLTDVNANSDEVSDEGNADHRGNGQRVRIEVYNMGKKNKEKEDHRRGVKEEIQSSSCEFDDDNVEQLSGPESGDSDSGPESMETEENGDDVQTRRNSYLAENTCSTNATHFVHLGDPPPPESNDGINLQFFEASSAEASTLEPRNTTKVHHDPTDDHGVPPPPGNKRFKGYTGCESLVRENSINKRKFLKQKHGLLKKANRNAVSGDSPPGVDIGEGIVISKFMDDYVRLISRDSPMKFLKNLLLEGKIFTLEELATHSVKGGSSNRVKLDGGEVRPRLDPLKLKVAVDYTINSLGLQSDPYKLAKFESNIKDLCTNARKLLNNIGKKKCS